MINVERCTFVIALARARNAVKHELWAKGEKPNLVAMSVIQRLAKDYLVRHPSMIDEAKVVAEVIYRQHQAKLAYQRHQRQMRRLANLTTAAQKSEPCGTTTNSVQQSRSKVEA